jgi:hypothetical protein
VHGKEKLAQLLQEYNHDKELDEAFMSAFGQSLGQFEQDWENWVKAKFKVDIPATVTPLPQEQSPASYPGRNVLAIIALLCCFSVAGATGLGLVILPLKATAKKTVS